MSIELGFVLLPETDISNLLPATLNDSEQNIYHLSLFQMSVAEDLVAPCLNHFAGLTKCVSQITCEFSAKSKLVDKNVFWTANQTPKLYSLHELILSSSLMSFSDGLLQQVSHSLEQEEILNERELALVKKYGIWWVEEYFNPHITLRYQVNDDPFKNIDFPTMLRFTRIAAGVLGYHGNLREILLELSLQPT